MCTSGGFSYLPITNSWKLSSLNSDVRNFYEKTSSTGWKELLKTQESSLLSFFFKVSVAAAAAAAAKSLQSCPTLCDPIDSSPPGSPIPGILQARTLEWVAISFSNAWKWKLKVKSLSRVQLLATPWTAASQAPPSMGFARQEYWSGVPLTRDYLFNLFWVCCAAYSILTRNRTRAPCTGSMES